MKKPIIIIAILSVALGIILTSLFASRKTDIHTFGDCAYTMNDTLPAAIRRVDCSGFAQGFPYTFIESRPSLDIDFLTEPGQSPLMLGVTAKATFNTGKLLANLAIWSLVSTAMLTGLRYWLLQRNRKKPESENHKKS